ncbi:MAG: hypothetical protein E7605_03565 [Ruminococcaceae bacterium]|nr:hypothetical protein [Oscillospiraceae bacterium]
MRPKKWRKKPDFGKPKSQVCLFAVANIAQARAQTLRAKGPNALWIPATRKVAALRSAHFFAKGCIFSFCVGVLNKNADTEGARKRNCKSFCHLRRTRVKQNFKQNDFVFCACRQNGLSRRQPLPRKKKLFLPPTAARGGKAAGDAAG